MSNGEHFESTGNFSNWVLRSLTRRPRSIWRGIGNRLLRIGGHSRTLSRRQLSITNLKGELIFKNHAPNNVSCKAIRLTGRQTDRLADWRTAKIKRLQALCPNHTQKAVKIHPNGFVRTSARNLFPRDITEINHWYQLTDANFDEGCRLALRK